MLCFHDFLDWEREIVLKYMHYMLPAPQQPLWIPLETFLLQYHNGLSLPPSCQKKNSILLFRDESESVAVIDRLAQQDSQIAQVCPHERHRNKLGSVFVLGQCDWDELENFLDFIAGVVHLHPETYENITPLSIGLPPPNCVTFRGRAHG